MADIRAEPMEFVVSIGEDNVRAIETLVEFPSQEEPVDAAVLAERFEKVAAETEPTHGRYFPKIKDEPDVHTVADAIAKACRKRAGKRLFVRRG